MAAIGLGRRNRPRRSRWRRRLDGSSVSLCGSASTNPQAAHRRSDVGERDDHRRRRCAGRECRDRSAERGGEARSHHRGRQNGVGALHDHRQRLLRNGVPTSAYALANALEGDEHHPRSQDACSHRLILAVRTMFLPLADGWEQEPYRGMVRLTLPEHTYRQPMPTLLFSTFRPCPSTRTRAKRAPRSR